MKLYDMKLFDDKFGSDNPAQKLPTFLTLRVVDQNDKWAPHFLQLGINQMTIYFSFDEPIAFKARNGNAAVWNGGRLNQQVHAGKARSYLKKVDGYTSRFKFMKFLVEELKKEIIHTSSDVMRDVFGVE